MLGAFLLTILAGPAGARAAAPGVVADLTWFPSEIERQKTALLLESSGSEWVRLDLGWQDFEPRQGEYSAWSLQHYEEELQRARAAGQRVILMVHKSPKWASGSDNEQAAPRDPGDYGRFLRFLGQRYGQYVDAWEIWNEPNLERFWPTGPDPRKYVRLLKAGYNAIQSSDPSAEVLFGGLSTNDYEFVKRAYAAGAKGYFDALATHPYSCARPPEQVVRTADGRMNRATFPAYREVRRVMRRNHDAKPIWFTEFGWSTTSRECGVSRATQADYLRRAFRYMEQDPYVKVATWYTFRNNYWENDRDETGAQYGLVDTDFDPKPSFLAFRRYALR